MTFQVTCSSLECHKGSAQDQSRASELNQTGRDGRVLSDRVSSQGTTRQHETLGTHVIECSPLGDDESNLWELGGKKLTARVTQSVLGSAVVDVGKQR
jgi:hypothetical protein